MKVAVTGATGNVGTTLLELLGADHEIEQVKAFARRRPSRSWPKTEFTALDVATEDLAPHLTGIDAVIHLAWAFHPARKPAVTWAVNLGAAQRAIEAAAQAGVRSFICASSVGAYSPGRGQLVGEDWPTNSLPTAGYGREKAYLERLLDIAEARHTQMRVVRLRPGFIFQRSSGPEQRRIFAGPFLPTTLLKPGMLPLLPFPAGFTFQALHASDAARAFLLALKSSAGGAFNIAAEPVLDGQSMARLLGAKLLPVPPSLARLGLFAAWAAHLAPVEPALFDLAYNLPLMRTDRARDELGWAPSTSADDAVAEALEGMREGSGGGTPPLAPDGPGTRWREVLTGVGRRHP